MRQRPNFRRIPVILAGCLLACFFLGISALLQVAPRVQAAPASGPTRLGAALDTPTTNDPTVTALEKEQLNQQIIQLQNANSSSWTGNLTLVSTLISALALILAGIFGIVRWFQDRRAEQEKRSEERFLRVVESLGAEREEARIGAAIMLRTFLKAGYQNFYYQAYDLAIAHLRLRDAPPAANNQAPNAPIPLTPLTQALITVFREAFPEARDLAQRDPRYFNASGLQLDHAYLSGADLRTIWMPQAHLQEAFLNRVNLSGALLSDCMFTHAELKNADLSQTQLRRVDFSYANLTGADLSHTKLRKAIFTGANVAGVDFTAAELPQADLSQVNIEQAKSLSQAKLYGVSGLTPEQRAFCTTQGALFEEQPLPTNAPPAVS
ncbi:MAG TPA: pentapeptide repeat-containing protein [Ktedonobacteraceae bacterium]